MLTRKIPVYKFENLAFSPLENADFLESDFYIEIPELSEIREEKTLLDVGGVLTVRVICRSYGDAVDGMDMLCREGCFYFKEDNEYILEVIARMTKPDGTSPERFSLHLPLSAPFVKERKIAFWFNGTWLRLVVDGEVVNENAGFDRFAQPQGDIFIDPSIAGVCVSAVHNVSRTFREYTEQYGADFYSPYLWNVFAGDVMNYYHNGVYHLLYLVDRRHHASRNGRGAHYIAHLTTKNLVDWYEQPPVVELDAPWKTCGTGTLVYHGGKYYMSYGWHTSRYDENTMLAPCTDNKEFNAISFEDVLKAGKLPMGATYAISDNGIDFTDSNMLYHSSQNPSIYADNNGKLTLWAGYGDGGIWQSDGFDKPFKLTDADFEILTKSVMRNTTECPSVFSFKGYKYIIIGFTGYYRTLTTDTYTYTDVAAQGENIYDGLCVPMVCEFAGDRRIIAGWLNGTGWGSVVVHRELVTEENGKLGMKWLPELTPKVSGLKAVDFEKGVSLEMGKSYYIKIRLEPKNALRAGLVFADQNGRACALQIDFARRELQINDTMPQKLAERLPTALEIMQNDLSRDNMPNGSVNFCIPDISGIGEKFTLRVLCRYSKKLHSTVIDAEVAGKRTIISVRKDFFPTSLSFKSDGEMGLSDTKMGVTAL